MSEVIKVAGIFTAPKQGADMQSQDYACVVAGKGLLGDRYARGKEFWQETGKYRDRIRHVSLFLSSSLEGTGFSGIQTRRNIELSGAIDLLGLIDHEFTIGGIVMRGVWDCAPCNRPATISGFIGYEKLDKAKGGLRAEVLSSGIIKLGDALIVSS